MGFKTVSGMAAAKGKRKLAHEVCNGSRQRFRGKYPPRTVHVYGIVCGVKRHLGDKNGDEALDPLDAHDKRYGKLSTLLLLVWYYIFRE